MEIHAPRRKRDRHAPRPRAMARSWRQRSADGCTPTGRPRQAAPTQWRRETGTYAADIAAAALKTRLTKRPTGGFRKVVLAAPTASVWRAVLEVETPPHLLADET